MRKTSISCARCGFEIPPETNTCPSCGWKYVSNEEERKKEEEDINHYKPRSRKNKKK